MKIIKPLTINPFWVQTNAPELHPAWSAATTYAKGAMVVRQYKNYESLTDSNLNKDPATSPLDWLATGPSNTTAAFDSGYTTQTVKTGTLSFQIFIPGVVNSLALLNLDALGAEIDVLMISQNTTVYHKVFTGDGTIITDMYEYYFEPAVPLKDIVFTDLPPYTTTTLYITITGTSVIKVGEIILGNYQSIGLTQYGLSFGIKDYSLKEENEYGDVVFKERNYAKKLEPSVEVYNSDLRRVTSFLSSIRAQPTVFIPTDFQRYDTLITYGFLADWNIDVTYPEHSLLRMEIKGLT